MFKEIQNKKAFHDYELIEKYEAGMCLIGADVKNILNNKFTLTGNYVKVLNNEVFLIGESSANSIKLLLHRSEINKLMGKVQDKGLTVVPLSIYRSKGKFKISIALARGKKEYDKRASDKNRDADLEARRVVKSQKFGEY